MSMEHLMKPACNLLDRLINGHWPGRVDCRLIKNTIPAFISNEEARQIKDYWLRMAVINDKGFLNKEMALHWLQGHDSRPSASHDRYAGRTASEIAALGFVIDDSRMEAAMNALHRAAHPTVEYFPGNELVMAKEAASLSAKFANEAMHELERAIPGWFERQKVKPAPEAVL